MEKIIFTNEEHDEHRMLFNRARSDGRLSKVDEKRFLVLHKKMLEWLAQDERKKRQKKS